MLLRVLPLLAHAAVAADSAAKPNFVILFVDDLGMNQIEVPESQRQYGYTGNNHTIKTPHISRLASEGMVFQTWYSAAHLCSPSRAAMMTGRLPIRAGVVPGVFSASAVGGLPPNETTIAAALGKAGYKTMAIGKWHLGQREMYLPTSHGFDSYLGIPFSQDMGLSYWFMCVGPPTAAGEPPACDPAPKGAFQPTPIPLLANKTVIEQPAGLYTLAARYARAATEFIEASAGSGPFYLYLAWNHVHAPNSCGAGFCGRSPRGPIGDATEEMDDAVGRVMDAIRGDARISQNTLVFFTSDNGAPMRPDGNLPLRGYKTSIWEGGFREPGIAWWPGKVKAGSSSGALVATYDIFPTLVQLAGAAPPPQHVVIDGVDISNVLFSDTPQHAAAHDCIMYYHQPESQDGPEGAAKLTGLSAVRCGDYKVYWFIDGTSSTPLPPGLKQGVLSLDAPAIFDLSKDWSEDSPLANGTDEWQAAKKRAEAARTAHIQTLTAVVNQEGRGSRDEYAICADPDSKQKYPDYPNCTISPDNWKPPICLLGGNIGQCIGQTQCRPGCRFVNCSAPA